MAWTENQLQPDHEQQDIDALALACAEELIKLKDSQGWKILMLQLGKDAQEARAALVDANADDPPAIQRLQNLAQRYNWFHYTIEELIQTGLASEQLEEALYGEDA